MGRNALAILEKLDRGGGVAGFELLTGKLIRNAVVVPVDLDVVIDIGTDGFPFRHYVGFGRQWLKGGMIDLGIREVNCGWRGDPVVSARGKVVADGFSWTATNGVRGLGTLGGNFGEIDARAVNAGGSVTGTS